MTRKRILSKILVKKYTTSCNEGSALINHNHCMKFPSRFDRPSFRS